MPARDAYLEARRQEILDAATSVFLRQGFAATTMQDVASEAGISVGNIYRYFPSKDEMVRAVCEGCQDQYDAFAEGVASGDTTPLQVLLSVAAEAWVELRAEDAEQTALLLLEAAIVGARDPAVASATRESLLQTRAFLEQLIEAGQECGDLRDDVEPGAAALALMAIVAGVRALTIQIGKEAASPAVERAAAALLEGLATRGAATDQREG